jgi:hypothetical protein
MTSNASSARRGAREGKVATRRQELLDELVGGGGQDADARADERVAERARQVTLADAGSPEQEHIAGALDEGAAGQLARLDEHVAGHAGGVEGVERLGRREPRCAAEPVDATLAAGLGFDLEHLGQGHERLIPSGIEEALGHLLGGARQLELGQQRRDAVAELGRVGGHAAPARVIRAS